MNSGSSKSHIEDLYSFACSRGFSREVFFSGENLDRYIEAVTDAFMDYPLFLHVFGGTYDDKTFSRMLAVDFKCRLNTIAGIASPGYESVMLIEPPGTAKTGMLQYVRSADTGSYGLLLKPAIYRLERFERYALKKRKGCLDDKTWYIYSFTTKREFQGKGYGKKLMELIVSYAEGKGLRICLETNSESNIGMYGHFGFESTDTSEYKGMIHSVMLYTGTDKGKSGGGQ